MDNINKRKISNSFDSDVSQTTKSMKTSDNIKKNSLDSDEEDDDIDEADYKLDEDDIEGEEDGVAGQYDEVRTTAFNMKEELEEGHFDKDGHYIWNKEKEIKDHWLDNIDWQVVKQVTKLDTKFKEKGLGDESDSDDESINKNFEIKQCYKDILSYMNPNESISKTLQRLGKSKKKLSTIERIKMKKAGLLDTNEHVVKLTELANNLLNHTGNMDIYQETYESISKQIGDTETSTKTGELDMYSDDFDDKEKKKLDTSASTSVSENNREVSNQNVVMWEFKWNQDDEKIEGPITSDQMQKWIDDGYFKKPVFVRKVGQDQFYSSARIDFELYIS